MAKATPTQWFWRVSGVVFAVAVLLDVLTLTGVTGAPPGLEVDWTHVVIHAILGGMGLYFGFVAAAAETGRRFILPVGIVYLVLGIVGFISPSLFGLAPAIGLTLETPENGLHTVLGLAAIIIGSMVRKEQA